MVARSILKALEFVSDGYQDKRGRQKKDIQRLIAGYILRNKSIHLLTRVQNISLSEDKAQADVILYVGIAGVPVTNSDQLLLIRKGGSDEHVGCICLLAAFINIKT